MQKSKLIIIACVFIIFNFSTMTFSYPSLYSSNQSDGLQITYPNGGEVLSGNIDILWTLEPPFASNVSGYNIYYSPNGGQDWIQLGFSYPGTSYTWNTDLFEDGSNYLLKIIAFSKEWFDKEAISASTFTINNSRFNLFGIFSGENAIFIGLLVVMLAIGTPGLGLYYYYTKRNRQSSFKSFFQLDRPTFLKEISQKLIIGIDNIQSGFIEEPLELPSMEIDAIIEPNSMIEYFPADFQYDLRSEIKGRTILTLIEIAYQNPSDTNPAKIAKSLDIPPSTLSKEIKKLKDLDYLQTHISKQVVEDARFRNFEITTKGFHFLSLLNTALKVTINRVKMNGRI